MFLPGSPAVGRQTITGHTPASTINPPLEPAQRSLMNRQRNLGAATYDTITNNQQKPQQKPQQKRALQGGERCKKQRDHHSVASSRKRKDSPISSPCSKKAKTCYQPPTSTIALGNLAFQKPIGPIKFAKANDAMEEAESEQEFDDSESEYESEEETDTSSGEES